MNRRHIAGNESSQGREESFDRMGRHLRDGQLDSVPREFGQGRGGPGEGNVHQLGHGVLLVVSKFHRAAPCPVKAASTAWRIVSEVNGLITNPTAPPASARVRVDDCTSAVAMTTRALASNARN